MNIEQERAEAAQSAPAGEREAFEAWARRPDNGVGKLDLRLCDIGLYYRRETGTAWDGFKAGAAWQRTQSVGVPEADLSSDERVAALCDLSYRAGLQAECDQLRAEVEVLRKDAGRYRLLRHKVRLAGGEFHILNLDPRYIAQDSAAELDAAIDAAMLEAREQ